MEIFILRHGHAESEAPSDAQRPLSPQGIQEVASTYERSSAELGGISRVLVSPFLRAQQTWGVIAPHFSGVSVETRQSLVPGGNPAALIEDLYQLAEGEGVTSVLLVSHQPLVGTLLDMLCGFEPGCYRMGTAALAAVDAPVVAAGCAEMRWLRQH